jgi:hypothetical protein
MQRRGGAGSDMATTTGGRRFGLLEGEFNHGRKWTAWTSEDARGRRAGRLPLHRGRVIMNNKVKQDSLRISQGGRWGLRLVKVVLRVVKVI